MLRQLWLVPVFLLFTACGTAEVKVVTRDYGGIVATRALEIRNLTGDVRIKGVCLSACAMYLNYPETCVYPDAIVGFHAPYSTKTGEITELGVWFYRKFLPESMHSDYDNLWSKSLELHEYTGNELNQRYGVKLC